MAVKIKRIYEPYATADGYRILVDRLWPRGIKKEKAHVDVWLKDVAPSTELRQWFGHQAERWSEFKTRYRAELKDSPAWKELQTYIHDHKTVTLLYGAKDEAHNQARALQAFLSE